MKELPLSKGMIALVSDEDFDALNQFKWSCASHGYAIRKVKAPAGSPQRFEYMHHAIMGKPGEGMQIDHVDRNPLNNQRENLREVSKHRNALNKRGFGKSAFRGVYQHSQTGRFVAQIVINGKTKHIGCFGSETEAAAAFNEFALRDDSEFRYLNQV